MTLARDDEENPVGMSKATFRSIMASFTAAFAHVWRSPWVKVMVALLLIGTVLFVFAWQFKNYSYILAAAVVGFLISYLLNPLVLLLRRVRIPRPIAVIISYLLFLGVIALGSILVSRIVVQLGVFVQYFPDLVDRSTEAFGKASGWFNDAVANVYDFLEERLAIEAQENFVDTLEDRVREMLTGGAETLSDSLNAFLSRASEWVLGGVTSVLSRFTQVILMVLTGFYFLLDYPRITKSFARLIPANLRPLASDLGEKADRAVGGYIRGQLLTGATLGLLIWVGLSILGVPLALAVGFIAAVFNLVPYLGPITASIPGILLALTVSPLTALLTAGVFVLANQLEGNVLAPIVLGRVVDIHPLTVLLAILVGFSVGGILGALVSVPLVTFTKLVFEDYVFSGPLPAAVGNSGSRQLPAGGPREEREADGE